MFLRVKPKTLEIFKDFVCSFLSVFHVLSFVKNRFSNLDGRDEVVRELSQSSLPPPHDGILNGMQHNKMSTL